MAADDDDRTIRSRQDGIVGGLERSNRSWCHGISPQLIVCVFIHVQHGLGHRHVDVLTSASSFALKECGQDRTCRLNCGVNVTVAVWIVCIGAASYVTLVLRDAGLGVDDRCVGPSRRPGARRPVPRDRRVDEPWALALEALVVESESLHDARAKVFDHDICRGDESSREFDTSWFVHVDRHVELADVLLHEVRRLRVDPRIGESGHVPSGGFHLDDLRTEIGEHAGRVRP